MIICFIADGNSIHARRWIEYFCKEENEIHILSTTYCAKPLAGAVIHNLGAPGKADIPVDSIGSREDLRPAGSPPESPGSSIRRLVPGSVVESELLSLNLLYYRTFRLAGKAGGVIKKLKPDLVHCLRLPIEGYIGGLVGYRPLVMSTWGNDMVYFAEKYCLCRRLTRKAMSRTGLYFSDSLRDKYIAEEYGFSPSGLTALMPVIGGLRMEEFAARRDPSALRAARQKLGMAQDTSVLISVRGFKNFYINTEALIRAIPQVTTLFPNAIFVVKGDTRSGAYAHLKGLAGRLGIEGHVRFTDRLGVEELIDYFTASDIMVSVTLYDGCPVSMLEGMAYGLIPAMSVHSPIQEWITDGDNGYLFDPRDPSSIARSLIRALKNKDSFATMRAKNRDMLRERADYYRNMQLAEEMYHRVTGLPGQGAAQG